jgi:hypothetical protein
MPLVAFVVLAAAAFNLPVNAQNPELQQRLAENKQAMAQNKEALAQYTWIEQVTISLKGEEEKQEHFQVRLGPDGKPQKTSLDPPADNQPEGGRLKKHRREEKGGIQRLRRSDDSLGSAVCSARQGSAAAGLSTGKHHDGSGGGEFQCHKLVIKNYLKQGDSMTLIFDKAQKELLQVQIASYMDDPKDAMNLTVQFTSFVSRVVLKPTC